MPRNSEIEVGRCPECFPSRSQHHVPNFLLCNKSLRNPGSVQRTIFAYLVDIEKAYDRVSRDKLWRVLQEFCIDWHLLIAIKPLYCQPEICVNGEQSKSFHVGVCLRQECVLSRFFFIVNMNWMDKLAEPMNESQLEDVRLVGFFSQMI